MTYKLHLSRPKPIVLMTKANMR